MTNRFTKDPNATKDFPVSWDRWLPTGDTIAVSNWYADAGITVTLAELASRATKVWLSGGTLYTEYAVTNRITSAQGRIEDATIYIMVVPN